MSLLSVRLLPDQQDGKESKKYFNREKNREKWAYCFSTFLLQCFVD